MQFETNNQLPEHWANQRPFREESEIVRQWGDRGQCPSVSVCCPVFNHLAWIEDALRGILAQETTFPFELIIRDDASTDGTSLLLQSYAVRYPRIIRLVIHKENEFKHGRRAIHDWPKLARGKYIAFCEGDDFWITTDKLQKQYDLMESSSDSPMCVALTHFYQQAGGQLAWQSTTNPPRKSLLGFDDVHRSYVHTSTYFIRSAILTDIVEKYYAGHCLFGDTALRAIMIQHGPFALLDEVVSVYRITGSGIWTSLDSLKKQQWEYRAAKRLAKVLTGKHAQLQRKRLYGLSYSLFRTYLSQYQYIDSIVLFPRAFLFGLRRVPSYALRKLRLGE